MTWILGLIFVGLVSSDLSVRRVETRVLEQGHGVPEPRLRERFPRTQKAIAAAIKVADASLLVDNSRCRMALKYDNPARLRSRCC